MSCLAVPRQPITRSDQQDSPTIMRAGDPEGRGAGPPTMGLSTLERVQDAPAGIFGHRKRGAGELVSSGSKPRSRREPVEHGPTTSASVAMGHAAWVTLARAVAAPTPKGGRATGNANASWSAARRTAPRQLPAAPGTRGQGRVINPD